MNALVGHQTRIQVGRRSVLTLADVLPEKAPMRMLIIGKTPAPGSVKAGHYFQGRQGRFLWNELKAFHILEVADEEFEDDALVRQGFGVTDVAKIPRNAGSEPGRREYQDGWAVVATTIDRLTPDLLFWPYKRTLDSVLRVALRDPRPTRYGFNPNLNRTFGRGVFVFGMMGTPCPTELRIRTMTALRRRLRQRRET